MQHRANLVQAGLLALLFAAAAAGLTVRFWKAASPAPIAHLVPVIQEASVAVLPFVNMGGDPAKEYFSDGISEELLNDLARVPELRVAARTSSFAFKGQNTDVQNIARRLHVRTVLQGSVREEGRRVRITAQLINASDGLHLWSQTYDRELTDILSLQNDIARAITRALTDRSVPASSGRTPAIDLQAYRLYLEARDDFHRGNRVDLEQAANLLKAVTEKEPNYANGYSALSAVLGTLGERYGKTALMVPAETAGRQALSLDPRNVEALTSLTLVLLDGWRWQEALDMFQKAQTVNPDSAAMLRLRSIVAFTFNYPQADIAAETKASERDPLQPAIKYGIAVWYRNNKRYDKAVEAIQHVLELRQGQPQDLDQQCAIEAGRGNLAAADAIAGKLSAFFSESPQNLMNCAFRTAIAEGNLALARKLTDNAAADAARNGGAYTIIADAYRQLDDLKSAMPWYERTFEARDSLLLLVPYEGWQTPEPLVSYPPWKALWARQPIREWETARVRAGQILRVGD